MLLFVYGTLMDPDLVRALLGRSPSEDWVSGAHISGFRVVPVAGRTYPMLVPHAGGWVAGHLIAGLDARAMGRLRRYEGRSYRLRRIWVRRPAGAPVAARMFVCPDENPGRRHWHLDLWQKRHKSAALRLLPPPTRFAHG